MKGRLEYRCWLEHWPRADLLMKMDYQLLKGSLSLVRKKVRIGKISYIIIFFDFDWEEPDKELAVVLDRKAEQHQSYLLKAIQTGKWLKKQTARVLKTQLPELL